MNVRKTYIVATALWAAVQSPGLNAERLTIPIAAFGGKAEHFDNVRYNLQDMIQNLASSVSATPEEMQYLSRLRLSAKEGSAFSSMSADDLKKYWNASNALEVVQGSIALDEKNNYFVQSSVFIGDLRGPYPHSSLLLEQRFLVGEYANTRDSHAAIILYALAVDAAKATPVRKSLVFKLLQNANSRLSDLRSRGALQPPLTELELAIREVELQVKAMP